MAASYLHRLLQTIDCTMLAIFQDISYYYLAVAKLVNSDVCVGDRYKFDIELYLHLGSVGELWKQHDWAQ